MANEISGLIQLRVQNGFYQDSVQQNLVIDQTTLGSAGGIQEFRGSPIDFVFDDVDPADYGLLYLHNLDETNPVQWGTSVSSTFHAAGMLKAGEACLVRLVPSTTYQAVGNLGNVKVEYFLLAN